MYRRMTYGKINIILLTADRETALFAVSRRFLFIRRYLYFVMLSLFELALVLKEP